MNYLAIGLLTGIGLAVASCGQPTASMITLQQKVLSHPNSTNYEFEASIGEVKAAIQIACGDAWRKELAERNRATVWNGGGDKESRRLLTKFLQAPEPHLFWKGQADTLARHLLTQTGNEDDAFIYGPDAPFESQIYLIDGHPVYYTADFHLHLVPVGPRKTRIEVFTYGPSAGVGVDERWSPHGPVLIEAAIEPSTVEEYRFLLRIGEQLGITNMPPLVTPGPGSPIKQILRPRK